MWDRINGKQKRDFGDTTREEKFLYNNDNNEGIFARFGTSWSIGLNEMKIGNNRSLENILQLWRTIVNKKEIHCRTQTHTHTPEQGNSYNY